MASADDRSASKSSDEVNQHLCEICKEYKKKVKAISYCCVCLQYMCKSCCDVHSAVRATKSHKLLAEHELPTTEVNKTTMHLMVCKVHAGEPIKLFCQEHSAPCCTSCGFLSHRTCSDVKEISELAAGVKESPLCTRTLKAYSDLEERVRQLQASQRQMLTTEKDCLKSLNQAMEKVKLSMSQSIKVKEYAMCTLGQIRKDIHTEQQGTRRAVQSYPDALVYIMLHDLTTLCDTYTKKVKTVLGEVAKQTDILKKSKQQLLTAIGKIQPSKNT